MGVDGLFLILFLFMVVTPTLKQWRINQLRLSAMRSLEKRRGSRVISLIHRQETMGFFGMFQRNFINIEDSEEVLRFIRMTPDHVPIDMVIHTPGGLLLAAEQIAEALRKHPSKVTVFVPHYAMSGGTLIALAADEIVMDRHAVLGPVDPQLGQWPAASIIKAVEQKPVEEVDDHTLIMADVARKAMRQTEDFVRRLLKSNGMEEERADALAKALTDGRWTHDYPINIDEARSLGLPVTDQMPDEICALMRLYPQSGQGRPSVQYVPLPFEHGVGAKASM
ncbi:SDH family Clp fold serine proteinase [Thermanaerovibrio acidaminovorans]|jgi:ClpP class serine protease|uniref:SDH family Clp fold serine proteinase n=1 Tax=Thermanaerovibrio acidaminovorans TaxID=81462 RepID=UPI0001A3D0C9|nr:ATP-dependent Clp protease proteolytic subunit [Thermanaerovibrio acidaminovorans]